MNLIELALSCGAANAVSLKGDQILWDRSFRALCEENSCGSCGKNYMCPPDVGDIDDLIARGKVYQNAILYQTIFPLEDSFDIEGMAEASVSHRKLSQTIENHLQKDADFPYLHLSAGGCQLCPRCGKLDGIPCRFPTQALASLESYGINVHLTSKNGGLRYTNGANTVTYFGIILLDPQKDA